MGLIKVAQLLGQTGEGGRTGLETADGPVDAQDPDKGMDAQPRLGPQQAGQVADAVAGLLGQGPRGGGTGGGGQMVQQGYGGGQSRAKGRPRSSACTKPSRSGLRRKHASARAYSPGESWASGQTRSASSHCGTPVKARSPPGWNSTKNRGGPDPRSLATVTVRVVGP